MSNNPLGLQIPPRKHRHLNAEITYRSDEEMDAFERELEKFIKQWDRTTNIRWVSIAWDSISRYDELYAAYKDVCDDIAALNEATRKQGGEA